LSRSETECASSASGDRKRVGKQVALGRRRATDQQAGNKRKRRCGTQTLKAEADVTTRTSNPGLERSLARQVGLGSDGDKYQSADDADEDSSTLKGTQQGQIRTDRAW
jgi:hypothetical protein